MIRYTVTNDRGGNISFEVTAENQEEAALNVLWLLGWSITTKDNENNGQRGERGNK